MTVETMESDPATMPTPMDVWHYRWNITLTWHPESNSRRYDTYLTADDPDELVEIVRRNSLDPRIVAYRYERQAVLDMSAAPTSCPGCRESYDRIAPQRWWCSCDCGGHHAYQCSACGHEQMYPELVMSSCCT